MKVKFAEHAAKDAVVRETYILDILFQEYGLRVTLELSFVILQGPFSWKSPIMDELPGCQRTPSKRPVGDRDAMVYVRRH